MDAHRIDPITDARWRLLATHPHASIFHSTPWLAALRDAYGYAPAAYLATDARGEVAGAIAFCELDDLCGQRVVCLPFSDVCDPLLVDRAALEPLLAALQAHRAPVQLRVFQACVPAPAAGFTLTRRKRWHLLDVTGSAQSLWSAMAPAARRAVRKAERDGVEIRPLRGVEGIGEFLHLHVQVRKQKYHLLPQPAAFFESLLRHFDTTGDWHPQGAFLDGRLIAATIFVRWRNRLYYKFNASAQDALAARPNNLLLWHGMRLAQSLACDTLDLGPSDDDQPGLIRFKQETGAVESELLFLQWTPSEWRDDRGDDARRMLSELTALFTAPEVPDAIALRAGAALYRYFA